MLDERPDIGVHHGRAGPGVLTNLGQQIDRQRHIGIGHFCPDQLGDTPLVFGVQKRPDQRNGHGLDTLFPKATDTAPDISFVERSTDFTGAQHALFDRASQRTRDQHGRLGKIRVIAVAVFLVAETNFERVFMAGGTEQAGLGSLVFDQGINSDGRTENDQVAVPQEIRHATAEIGSDLLKSLAHGTGRVVRGGRRLVETDAFSGRGQNKVGKRPAGIDAETVGVL